MVSRNQLPSDPPRWVVPAVCLFLVAIVWVVFGQTLKHDFVNYDDDAYVRERPEIIGGLTLDGVTRAFTHTYVSNWQPLTAISHMLDCQFFGLNPGGHHFTNVFLHGLAAVLLFLVLRAMTGKIWPSAFVAALFAVHPLHVESVAWIAERKDVLSGVFFMLTLGAYVRYVRQPSAVPYVTMSLLFVCGLMSKPMLVTLPFLLLLLDYWPIQRESSFGKLVLEKIPLLLLAAGAALATVFTQGATIKSLEHLPMSWRIENAFVSIVTYIGQIFCPARLAVFYPHPHDRLSGWMVALSIALVLGFSMLAPIIGRQRGYAVTGWFWYLGMLVPVLGLVQVGLQGHADRYTYLPHIGLYVLITWAIVDLTARWPYRRSVLAVAATVVIIALTWSATLQASHWRNSETLWRHTLAVTFDNDVAHTNLGNLLSANEAVPHYEEALRIAPHAILPLNNLAWILATSPDASLRNGGKAIELAGEADQLSGGKDPAVTRTLGAAYAEVERFDEAIATAQQALALAVTDGNEPLADDLRNNIENFRRKTPVRDSSLANTLHP
jgi:hypothetical protein